MSWRYSNQWAERLSDFEILKVRDELAWLINIDSPWFAKKSGNFIDNHWNWNLLLPNFLTDKDDNGDMDIFLFDNWKIDFNKTIKAIAAKSEKNDRNGWVTSFLFNSESIGKKIQVDLHTKWKEGEFKNSYFPYYQIPYLFFVIGKIFIKADLRITEKWVFKTGRLTIENGSIIDVDTCITKNLTKFIEEVFDMKWKDISSIDSYQWIESFIENSFLWKMNLSSIFDKEENLKIKKIFNKNESKEYNRQELVTTILEKVNNKYPFVEKKMIATIQNVEIEFNSRKEKEDHLRYFFWVESFKDLNPELKTYIHSYKNQAPTLKILKDIQKKIEKKYWSDQDIYAVGGCVRDIFLWTWVNDWDITGTLSSEDFVSLFGWVATEKMWTVMAKIDWLEVEYTPFRKEWKYDWREPTEVTFWATLEEDSQRRDFTINSLYLSLKDGTIKDFHWWLNDIKTGTVKCVWIAKDRFDEDYLRILRGLRFKSMLETKLWKSKYDENTYSDMISCYKELEDVSTYRISEEYMKWLKHNSYLKNINIYWKDVVNIHWQFFPSLNKASDIYDKVKSVYIPLFCILWEDTEKFKAFHSKYISADHKNVFLLANNFIKKNWWIDYTRISSDQSYLKWFLFDIINNWWANILVDYKKITLFLKEYSGLLIKDWFIQYDDYKKLHIAFKSLRLTGEPFSMKQLKQNGFDFEKIMKEMNITPRDLVALTKNKILDWTYKELYQSNTEKIDIWHIDKKSYKLKTLL